MAIRGGLNLLLFVVLYFFSFNANNIIVSSLTHDEKVDLITKAHDSLRHVVQTLIDVHTAIQETAKGTDGDISKLDDSKSRSSYEVDVMTTEHKIMLAAAAKRSDVSPEETQNAEDRGKAIEDARNKVGELGTKITETTEKLNAINQQMATTTLSETHLDDLQKKANEADPDADPITLPKTSEIKEKANEELQNMQTVIDTLTDAAVKKEAQELKNTIATKLDLALNEQSNFATLTVTCKEIDVALVHFKNLDIYGSSARMEL